MKFLFKKNPNFFPQDSLFLIFGFVWVTFNVYLLPFSVWTAGILRPWYMAHGYMPYKDFVWMREPLDLFILKIWYQLFGFTPFAYQLFNYMLMLLLMFFVFIISYRFFNNTWKYIFTFFIVILFPLFQNTEEGELLIGFFSFITFSLVLFYLEKRKPFLSFFIGFFSGICLITKQNSGLVLFIFPLLLLLCVFIDKKSINSAIRNLAIYAAGVMFPVFSLLLYFTLNNGLSDYLYYTIFIVLGPYRDSEVIHGDGLWIIAGYVSLIIPFLLFRKKRHVSFITSILVSLFAFSLFPSLLPSYLSYRAYTIFPFISIIAGSNLYFLFSEKQNSKFSKSIMLISFLLFSFFTYRFFDSYISAIRYGEIQPNQLLTSYTQTEYNIADWIKNNSKKDEKIMNYGSEMIYLLSNRLPKNKYVDPFPYILKPYDQSLKVFVQNPPKIVVYDESLPNDHPGLSQWPVISFLYTKYKLVKRFDKNLVIFEYPQN